jgi:N-acetylglutamate synthase-like GNAT family acetyltransferase
MSENQFVVRRANVDDLAGLRILWERGRLQVLDVEKRLTDFQLIARPDGDLIGAVALRIDRKDGLIHSEAFLRPDEAPEARPFLWDRLRTLARNHGLARLWTRERSDYWADVGFQEPSDGQLEALPESFGDRSGRWLTLGLRDESPATISIEKEFELFQQAQRASTEQLMAQARLFKTIVIGAILLLVAAAVVAALWFMIKQQQAPRGIAPRAEVSLPIPRLPDR